MSSYLTKVLSEDMAQSFIANMRWFAGIGRVSWRKLPDGSISVRASRAAWSMWDDR